MVNIKYTTMKIKYTVLCFLLSVMLLQCTQQKKLTYNIPPQISVTNRQLLVANIENGGKLFKRNCGSCHGIFTKGKANVPNFTDKQIESYQLMYKLKDPKNHAFAKNLLPEEMKQISIFLKFVRTDSTSID